MKCRGLGRWGFYGRVGELPVDAQFQVSCNHEEIVHMMHDIGYSDDEAEDMASQLPCCLADYSQTGRDGYLDIIYCKRDAGTTISLDDVLIEFVRCNYTLDEDGNASASWLG